MLRMPIFDHELGAKNIGPVCPICSRCQASQYIDRAAVNPIDGTQNRTSRAGQLHCKTVGIARKTVLKTRNLISPKNAKKLDTDFVHVLY